MARGASRAGSRVPDAGAGKCGMGLGSGGGIGGEQHFDLGAAGGVAELD